MTTKEQLAHRAALHAQAIAASEGVHPLIAEILRGQAEAQVATARAMQAANEPTNAGEVKHGQD